MFTESQTPKPSPTPPQAVRIAFIIEPAVAGQVTPPTLPGVDIRLHLTELQKLDPVSPFLRGADALILTVDPKRADDVALITRLANGQPRPVIAAAFDLTVQDTRTLVRAGALDVLPLPVALPDIGEAIDLIRRTLAGRKEEIRRGRVISFAHAVGGAGATALAVQAGCLFAAKQQTCLIDLDVQYGSAGLYLDLDAPLGVLDLAGAGERLDTTMVETVTVRHSSGLRLIAGPTAMASLDALDSRAVNQIIGIAAQQNDVVLIDLPAASTGWSLAALQASDAICVVTQLSVPGLRQARRLLDLLELNGMHAQIRLVLNRVVKKWLRTIDLSDSERVLQRKVDFTIANDYPTVSAAIDQGRTFNELRLKAQVEKDLQALVAGLAEVPA